MIYVYCVTRDAVTPQVDGVDGTRHFGTATSGGISAVFTPVDAESFSQEAIDARAGDLEWLGAIGYRHQDVVSDLMKHTAIVPLRAFTLFSSEEALRAYLHEHREMLDRILERLDGKQEWTPPGAEAACAAPATVKQTTPQGVTPFHPATGRSETGAWEGGKGSICQPGYRPTRRLPHRQP